MSTSASGLSGAVLAGGESRRMGRDKAQLLVDGEPLWLRQVRILTEAGAAPVSVVRRRGQTSLSDRVPQAWDTFENIGPLAGLHAALSASSQALVAVVAVDLPACDVEFFRDLHRRCQPGQGVAIRHAGGFEPLAAIYPRRALATVVDQLRRQEHSLQRLLVRLIESGQMTAIELSNAQCSSLANANTPGELAAHLAVRDALTAENGAF